MLFPYFIYVAHTTKFTRGTICFWKNLQGKSKPEESPRSRKKKSPSKKERKEARVPFCPEKKKNTFLKATGRS